jgi:sRNA-binding protein
VEEKSILMKTSAVGYLSGSFVAFLSLASVLGLAAAAQQSAPVSNNAAEPTTATTSSKPMLTPEERKKADLRADTEKLYRLTQELKVEVAKSNKDTLSVGVVKKAQEIERLAKSIKERSRNP